MTRTAYGPPTVTQLTKNVRPVLRVVFAEEVVKRKLRSLRTSYTRELNEVRRREAERAPGEPVKKPRWKWFHLMDPFLRPYCSSRKDVANSNRVGCLSAAASRPFFSRLACTSD